jgi:hypothetical protein
MSEHNRLTGPHYGLAGINHRALIAELGTHALNQVAVVIGSGTLSAIDYDAFDFKIKGAAYAQAAGTDEALTVLDFYGETVVQAKGTTCFYLLSVNAAGTENATKGKDDETTDLPGLAETECLISIVEITTNASTTFTIGTTSFGAAGITDTFHDYINMPVTAP